MAYTTINKSTDYFNTKLYSGTGSSQAVSGVGFQPDWIWFKSRTSAENHNLFDAIRGSNKIIQSSTNNAEATSTALLTSFDSDGFTVNTDGGVNGSGQTYASWNWKANGAGSANTDGSISSTVSANTTSGFSIVSYTGNGTGNSTIGHGLGATPKFIIVKNRTTAQAWGTYSPSFVSASDPNILYLNVTSAQADDTNVWGTSASFNNNTFTVGDWNGSNQSGSSFIAYCFAEKTGYSKFGKYTGNGNADGTFVYTGFKPAFTIIKRTDASANWIMMDNKRDIDNVVSNRIFPNSSSAQNTNTDMMDFLSNGFKLKATSGESNTSGGTYIYMAFAEAPLVGTNNIPANAR